MGSRRLVLFAFSGKERPVGESPAIPEKQKIQKKEGRSMDQLVQHQQTINDQLARYGVKFGLYKTQLAPNKEQLDFLVDALLDSSKPDATAPELVAAAACKRKPGIFIAGKRQKAAVKEELPYPVRILEFLVDYKSQRFHVRNRWLFRLWASLVWL